MGGSVFSNSGGDDGTHIKAIRYAIDHGMNVIDTAEIYANGHTEEIVGKAIKGYDRDKLFIITKVFPLKLRYGKIIASVRKSLQRMGLDYIDLYLLHWPTSKAEIIKAMQVMEHLMDMELIRNIGVANFSVNDMKVASGALKRYGIAANEIAYSLIRKDPEDMVIPYCNNHKIKVIAHTPLAKGRVLKMQELQDMATRYERKPVQLALNYLMQKSIPIPKSSNIKHIRDIISSVDVELSEEDYTELSEL